MKRDHVLIQALRFAEGQTEGFTRSDLKKYLDCPEQNWGVLNREFEGQKRENFFNQFNSRDGEDLYMMTSAGLKMLYEIEEVRQAKIQARIAMIVALASLITAIASIVSSA